MGLNQFGDFIDLDPQFLYFVDPDPHHWCNVWRSLWTCLSLLMAVTFFQKYRFYLKWPLPVFQHCCFLSVRFFVWYYWFLSVCWYACLSLSFHDYKYGHRGICFALWSFPCFWLIFPLFIFFPKSFFFKFIPPSVIPPPSTLSIFYTKYLCPCSNELHG